MNLGLEGKRAIVTGGSLGTGKAIAREGREGADVALVAHTKDTLDAAARELAAATRRRVIPLAADVTRREQVDAMVAQAEVEKADFAPESPRGNAIGRMVDAAEIAYVTAFLASDKVWAISGELIVATGGAGRSVCY